MNGALVIDKPKGWTSHDVVARVRRLMQERSIGHLGTLDPMATGVLPLLVGRYTRLAQYFGESEKTYKGVIRFGFATDTYDADGEPTSNPQQVGLTTAGVEVLLEGLVGRIEQVPPPFSAKKIQGVPAYKFARKRTEVALKPVVVTVHEFRVPKVERDRAWFEARVSAGTYIRSLAHEMGQKLGCGAHLAELRRTRSGEFGLEQAVSLDQLDQLERDGQVKTAVISSRKLLAHLPNVIAVGDQAAKIRNGNAVNLAEFSQAPLVKVFAEKEDLIAIAARIAGTLFQPKVVLNVTSENLSK
jgi:tRNA pseudouridine55 synthase